MGYRSGYSVSLWNQGYEISKSSKRANLTKEEFGDAMQARMDAKLEWMSEHDTTYKKLDAAYMKAIRTLQAANSKIGKEYQYRLLSAVLDDLGIENTQEARDYILPIVIWG